MANIKKPEPPLSPSKQFYRRPLPPTCVDFVSQEGKRLFSEALNEGTLNIYFKLAPQFQTQEEPAFCGLSSLVMTLNALEVDPGKIWKGPWRWYHESMLDCCKPLEQIKSTGINFEQFVCLAQCNRLIVEKTYAYNNGPNEEKAIDKFRSFVIKSVKSENEVLILSYDRSRLGQTGTGHFSPVGGYHTATDKILILDVARFKYPPHWVDLEVCYKAMQSFDPETNRSRGYLALKLAEQSTSLLLLQLITSYSDLKSIYMCWKSFFSDPAQISDIIKDNCSPEMSDAQLVESMLNHWAGRCMHKAVGLRDGFDITSEGRLCCHCNTSVEHLNVVEFEILKELKSLSEYSYLKNQLNLEPKEAMLVASLFLSWPFEMFSNELADRLAVYCKTKSSQLTDLARNEIVQLKIQLMVIMNDLSSGNGSMGTLKPSNPGDGAL